MKNTGVVLEMDLSREERVGRKAIILKLTEERQATRVNGIVTEKRSLTVVWKNVRRDRQSEIID